MKNFVTQLFCLLLMFAFSIDTATAQSTGKAGGSGTPFFNTSGFGGQLGHLQAGNFGQFTFGSRWISTGQPFVPSGQEFYGMRIQDRQYTGIFSLNAVNGNNSQKDLEITYGRVPIISPIQPVPYDPSLNILRTTSATTTALVMKMNATGSVGINMVPNSNFKLDVTGRTRCTQGFWITSDRRYKENISELSNVSEKLARVKGVSYDMKNEVINGIDFTQDRNTQKEIGFIAQDIAKEFPELVIADNAGYYSVRYEGLIPVLVQGFKEQNIVNQEQSETIDEQNLLIAEQENVITALNNKLENMDKQIQSILKSVNVLESSASLQLTPKFSKETTGVLEQNRPNPFKGVTTIAYTLPVKANNGILTIVNMEGKQIANYNVSDRQGTIDFDGSNLAAGTYFYSLVVNGERLAQQKMVVQ